MGNFRITQGAVVTDKENLASIDYRYGPYATVQAAHAALSADGLNAVGLTVGIKPTGSNTITEYWYQGNPPTLVPKQTGGGGDMSNYYTKSQTDGAISNALEGLTGGASDTTDPHVEVEVTQTNGLITEVVVTTDDIAGATQTAADINAAKAAVKSEIIGGASTGYDTLKEVETAIKAEETRAKSAESDNAASIALVDSNRQIEEARLQSSVAQNRNSIGLMKTTINQMSQSVAQLDGHDIIVVDELPASPDANVIYRLVTTDGDDVSYEDYMYNEDDLTTPIKVSTYALPGIDEAVTKDSEKLLTSGSVFKAIQNDAVYDISVNNAIDSTPIKYPSLADALQQVPSDYQVGGINIKFIKDEPAYYHVKREISDTSSGTIASPSVDLSTGDYVADNIPSAFTSLPSTVGASKTYYQVNLVDEQAQGYKIWTVTKIANDTSHYVQYRLMSPTWSPAVGDWQGVDSEPVAGSENLVKSGGVFASAPYQILSENANERYSYVPVKIKQGHTYRIKKTPNYSYNDGNCVLYFRVYKTDNTVQKMVTLLSNKEYIDVIAERDYNWLVFDNPSQTVGHTKEIYFFDVDELLQKTIVEKTKFSTNESLNNVGIDHEIISGSTNLLTGDAVFDVACKTALSINTDNVYQAIFKQGKTYIIVNTGTATTPNLSTRATSSGATIDSIGIIAKGNQAEFTASEDANYLRCGAGGGATTLEIFEKGQIQHKLFSDEKRITVLEGETQANAEALSELSDNYVKTLVFDKLLTDDYVLGKSINTNVPVGQTVDITPGDSSSFAYIIVGCKEGDVFVLSGVGGTNPKLYCFTDADYIKTQDGSVNSGTNIFITAPNDGYFISNVNYKHIKGYSLGEIYVSKDANTIENRVDEIYTKCTDVDNVPVLNSDKFVKSGGVFAELNEPEEKVVEVELDDSISTYVNASRNISTNPSTGYTLYYLTCHKGDKFELSYESNGPSSSAARIYAVFSVDDISEAGSSNCVAYGEMLSSIVANEKIEIEITDDTAKLLTIQKMVSGLISLVPKLTNTTIVYNNKFDKIDEELTGNTLEECPLSEVPNEDVLDGNYIVTNGNLQSNNLFTCYRFDCAKGDKFSIFTFKALSSDMARYYGIYNSKDTFSSSTKLETGPKFGEFGVGRIDVEITQDDAKSILIGSCGNSNIQVFRQKNTSAISVIESDVNNLRHDAIKVHFTYEHELKTTNIREVFDLTNAVHEEYWGLTGMNSLMYQIQDKMDELATLNPSYITKFDAAELVGLEYPEYANGIDTEGTYLVTPAYKTYGYKLAYNSRGVNGLCNRPTRILVTGSVHGNEQSASLNLYTIMKELCNDYLLDVNLFKIRAAFEIYIVPCVNGYSSIHRDRKNANGVNINRNFPCKNWDEQGSDNPDSGNYRGPYAGSEFETQLVMALINKIKPDMFIDAHNYSTSDPLQFFTEMTDYRTVRLAYDSLADVSFALKKAYPLWFGDNYAMLKGDSTHDNSGHAPADHDNSTGKSPVYAFDHGVPFAATIEISGGINYTNGELEGHDSYIEEVYQIGEYTFMNQLKRYGEFVSNNIVSTRYTDWRAW